MWRPGCLARVVSRGRNDHLPFDLLGLAFWVSVDAATDLTAAGVRGLLSNFAAVEATRAEVFSFAGFLVDMRVPYQFAERGKDGNQVLLIPARVDQANNSI